MPAPFTRPTSIPSHVNYLPDVPRPAERRGRKPKVSRREMLEAAIQEFAAHGLDGSTTASIARNLGITQPLLHYHFDSKEQLWLESVYVLFLSLWNDLEPALLKAKNDGSRSSARELLKVVVTALAERPELVRVVVIEGYNSNSPRMALLAESYLQPVFSLVQEALNAHCKRASLRDQPDELLVLAFLGAATTWLTLGPVCRELYGFKVNSTDIIDKQVALLEALFVG